MKNPVRKKRVSARMEPTRVRCIKIFGRLSEFLDGELDAGRCELIERHLKKCINCCAFFNTFKRTVALCRRSPRRRVPPGVRKRLLDRLEKEGRKQKKRSRPLMSESP